MGGFNNQRDDPESVKIEDPLSELVNPATEEKQDEQISEQKIIEEILQDAVNKLASLASCRGAAADLRVTLLTGSSTGSASATGVSSKQDSEIPLKKNTKYLFRLTSGTNDNLVNFKLSWYEKTNNLQ